MAMELKHGREGVVIGVSIGKGLGMDLVYIDFIQEMFMQESGQMGRVMVVGFIPARMEAAMSENSSGV